MKKRPWKKFARVERREYNNGDVVFHTAACSGFVWSNPPSGDFQTRDEAVAALDAWWKEFWPKQIKSTRPA